MTKRFLTLSALAPDETPLTDTWKKNPLRQKLGAVGRGYEFSRDHGTRGRGPITLGLRVAQATESRWLQDAGPAGAFRAR